MWESSSSNESSSSSSSSTGSSFWGGSSSGSRDDWLIQLAIGLTLTLAAAILAAVWYVINGCYRLCKWDWPVGVPVTALVVLLTAAGVLDAHRQQESRQPERVRRRQAIQSSGINRETHEGRKRESEPERQPTPSPSGGPVGEPPKNPNELPGVGTFRIVGRLSIPKDARFISIEEPVSLVLPSGMRLIGRVDFVLETDDYVEVGDVKTSAKSWTAEEVWKGQDQLVIYREALRSKLEELGKPIKLAWEVVTKTKEPRVQHIELTDAPATAERAIRIASEVERGIEADRFFPQPGMACLSCRLREPCRRWGTTVPPEVSDKEDAPEEDNVELEVEE